LYTLDDGEVCVIEGKSVQFHNARGKPITKQPLELTTKSAPPDKGKFATFMEKEIHEIPRVIDTIRRRYNDIVQTPEFDRIAERLRDAKTVHICACGTARHAGMMIEQMLESRCNLRAKTYIASEFANCDPHIEPGDIGMVITQSGETADTIAAMRHMIASGLPVIAICNVEGSSIARYADYTLPTYAGTEIAVASTKAFIAQVLVGNILTNHVAHLAMPPLSTTKRSAEEILKQAPEIRKIAKRFAKIAKIFVLGKGEGQILALESALKIKEITYKHCEGFASGELKHGTLSLVDEETLSIVLGSSDPQLAPKIANAIAEVKARGSRVWEIKQRSMLNAQCLNVLSVIPVQLFALYLAEELGLNPDQPRNLAKSVTVE